MGTFGLDKKGRNILINRTIEENDYVLDAGGGTGITAIKAGDKVGEKGGLLGIAHSTDSNIKIVKWISSKIENIIWKFPGLSLGCRNISLVNDIRKLDVDIIEEKTIGFIPFFFKILIIKKK